MDSNLRELINELRDFLSRTTTEQRKANIDRLANDADLSWEASRFFAAVIHKAQPIGHYLTLEQFIDFKANYEKDTHKIVNDHKLFDKFWLRNVVGFVLISGGISSLTRRFGEFMDFKNELCFWLDFQNTRTKRDEKSTDKAIVEQHIAVYENEKNIKLDQEGVYFNRWTTVKGDKVEYANIEIYFKQYIDYWHDFEFLWAFQQLTNADHNRLPMIAQEDFDLLYQSFQKFYPKIPPIEKIVTEKTIRDVGGYFIIDFYNNETKYWETLNDKISGLYWELLINDENYKNDEERLKTWLTKMLYWSYWPDPLKFTSEKSSIRFLNTAFELVINQPDLLGVENEFTRIYLDERMSFDTIGSLDRTVGAGEFTLNNSDTYELLASFNRWERNGDSTYLYTQGSRNMLAFLIKMLVNHDPEYVSHSSVTLNVQAVNHFQRIISLLKDSLMKPYLVWKVTQFILRDRPELMPYLIVDHDLATLSFILLDDIEFLDNKEALNLELWAKSAKLFLLTLSRDKSELTAKKIFQLYRSLNRNKYQIPYNRVDRKLEVETKENHDRKESVVLHLLEDSLLHPYIRNKGDSEYFLPVIYESLATVVINHTSTPLYRNGTVQFPILQWDAISWLFKASTYWKYRNQAFLFKESIDNLSGQFLTRYLESIEVTEISKYNFFIDKEEKGVPMWSEKIERLRFIDWIYLIYFVNEMGLLNQLLTPRINIEKTSNRYHEKNKFSADKLRTHIGVLLQVLRKLLLPVLPYGFEPEKLKVIKSRIEDQIIYYIKTNISDQPTEGKIDLFNYNKEWEFHSTDNEALFPQIARAINWFSSKDAIINAISESGDISKLLTLLDMVKSQGVRQKLIDKISALDVQGLLEKHSWIPEIQNTVTSLSKYPELLPQIEQATDFWKQRVVNKRGETKYQMVLYKTELLIAYFKKSETGIDNVTEPKINNHSLSDVQNKDYKQFYKGLLKISSHPQQAYDIFDGLVRQYPKYPSFALNRMLAKINLAEEKNDVSHYREALEEWREIETTLDSETIDLLEPELSDYTMTVLSKIGDYEQLNKRYETLDLPDRMQPSAIEIMLQSLVAQNKVDEALKLISAAKTYHQFGDIKDIQVLVDIENTVNQLDNLDELRGYYQMIFSSDPKKLIKIFPEYLNGRIDIDEFIVKEIVFAADKLLEKIQSISEIKNEDKYNDLIELALDARINPWGWHIGAQSRGAFSGSGGIQPGERDLPIVNHFKRTMMVCEAFIYRGSSTAKSHLTKVFNYHHQKRAFALLVYDLCETPAMFHANWKKYSEKIVPSISFPAGFEIVGAAKDRSKDFDFDKSAIRICSTEHGDGTILYHIFVHIHYKV